MTTATATVAGDLLMTADEARTTITAINHNLDTTRFLLLDLKEREGWRALGYPSWRACALAEFGGSESRVYQLLDAAKVDRAVSTIVEGAAPIPEAHARLLAPVLRHAGPALTADIYAFTLGSRTPREISTDDLDETIGRYREAGVISIPHRFASTKVYHASESEEWYTPAPIFEAAARVLTNGIGLDPCADPERRIPAAAHYTRDRNGLAHPWRVPVFMNPPFRRGAARIEDWTDTLVAELTTSHCPEAIALVPARVDTDWWQRLTAAGPLVCFVDGRLHFQRADGTSGPAPFPSAVVYFGPAPERFTAEFAGFGPIWRLTHPRQDGGVA